MRRLIKTVFAILFLNIQSIGQPATLLASYPFNGNANDEHNNNLHGTVFGDASLTTDRFGNANSAYAFDGIDDYIEVLDNDLLDFGATEDYSISVWVRPAATQVDQAGNNNTIITKWNELITSGYPYFVRYWNDQVSTANSIFTGRYDSQVCANNPITTSDQSLIQKWHHVVVVKSGANIQLYQDNVLVGEVLDNTSASCGTENDANLRIGSRELFGSSTGGVRFFTGDIDDITIYSGSLSLGEIESLFNEDGWPVITNETDILSFALDEQTSEATINDVDHTIDIEVAFGTTLTSLIPTISISPGATINPPGAAPLDFTDPVTYTITAGDGTIVQDWTVTVTVQIIHIAQYPFNGNANDESGNDLHGTVFGNATLTEDRFGNENSAYFFDGTDDYIEVSDDNLLDFGVADDYSISVWAKPSANQEDQDGNNNAIISKWNELITSGYPYFVWYWNDQASTTANSFFTGRYDSQFCNNNPIVSSETSVAEDWHHIVAVKSGANLRIYQDNVLVGEILDTTSGSCGTKNEADLRIGARELFGSATGGVRFFTGHIDDIDIFAKALSPEEIGELFNVGGWPLSSEAEILSFNFPDQTTDATINNQENTIDIEVAFGTDITALTPTIEISPGATILPESGKPQDFSEPVTYLVIAQDGEASQTWTVNVTVDSNNRDIGCLVKKPNGELLAQGLAKLSRSKGRITYIKKFENGDCSLSEVEKGDYLLKIIPLGPDLLRVLPTYYKSSLWHGNADVLTIDKDLDIEMTMLDWRTVADRIRGKGQIVGRVVSADDDPSGRRLGGKDTQGEGIEDVIVYLVDLTSGDVYDYATTDENGDFTFRDVASGQYDVVIDIVGIPVENSTVPLDFDEDSGTVEISATISESEESEIILETEIVLSTLNSENELMLYPNPTENSVFIIGLTQAENKIAILDLEVRVLKELILRNNQQELSLKGLNPGTYFIKVDNIPDRVFRVVKY